MLPFFVMLISNNKRKMVVLGEHEPTDPECVWEHDEDEEDQKVTIEQVDETKGAQPMDASGNEAMATDAVRLCPKAVFAIV